MATSGAVIAADTGMSPEKRVARSAPIRCTPTYQQTNPTTVTTAACHSSATTSCPVGTRSMAVPSTSSPARTDSSAATPHTVADSVLGPSGSSTGTASTANPTSPTRAATDHAIPAASVRPHPCTVNAPAATSSAPYSTGRAGRRPARAGTSTATTTGAQPTNTPGTAGSAVRSAASTARLNPTIPTAASTATRAHWRVVSPRTAPAAPRPASGSSNRKARP